MKHKDVVSAIVGGAFFAVPYLGLSFALTPAIAIGALAFGASELVLSGVNTKVDLKTSDKPLYERLVLAKKQNKEIKALIPKVESIETRKKLSEIHETVNEIIGTVEANPKKAKQLNNFFEYYLPVLIKIVNQYDEVENKRLKTKEGTEFMEKANKMISETADAFDALLGSMYQKDIIDADADMKVYDIMLKADGIAGDNLIMKGSKDHEK